MGCRSTEHRCEKSGGEWLEDACRPGLKSGTCPPGSTAQVGDSECAPVGTGPCAAGFETAADGWGCQPVFAPGCRPGQRPVLGERSCQPIDDCQRPFPPAAATIFVDDDYPAGELDATHFASLTAAVAAAPAGAHLAIERGVYEGVIVLERPMTLEGRCVAGTLIGDLMAGWSVVVDAGVAASLSHVSFGVYTGGIVVRAGASLEASHLYLGSVGALGLLAEGPGAAIRAREIVIDDMIAVDISMADGIPAVARGGGSVSLTESWIDGYYQTAGLATGAGSRMAFDRVIAGGGTPGAANSAFAMLAEAGGRLDATGSAFAHTAFNGFHVSGEGSLLIARDVTVLDAASVATGGARGRALDVQEGAEAQISGFTFRGGADAVMLLSDAQVFLDHGVVRGVTLDDGVSVLNTGVAVIDGAEANLTRVAVLDTANDAVVAAGVGPSGTASHLVLREALIAGCHRNDQNGQGVGLAVVDGATARAERLTIRDAGWVGVQVSGPDASLDAEGLAVIDTRAAESDRPGLGLVVEDHARLLLTGSRLRGTDGIGLVVGSDLAGASGGERAGVADTVIESNTVGVNTQNAVAVEVATSLPEALPEDRLLLTEDTLFRENALRLASERVVLPAAPPPFSP